MHRWLGQSDERSGIRDLLFMLYARPTPSDLDDDSLLGVVQTVLNQIKTIDLIELPNPTIFQSFSFSLTSTVHVEDGCGSNLDCSCAVCHDNYASGMDIAICHWDPELKRFTSGFEWTSEPWVDFSESYNIIETQIHGEYRESSSVVVGVSNVIGDRRLAIGLTDIIVCLSHVSSWGLTNSNCVRLFVIHLLMNTDQYPDRRELFHKPNHAQLFDNLFTPGVPFGWM